MEKIVTRVFILNEDGEVLLVKRARGAGANQWALIGGRPDTAEAFRDTISREAKKELGVDFTPKFWRKILDDSVDEIDPWNVYLYTGTIGGELVLNPSEISEVTYVSSTTYQKLDIAFSHRDLLEVFFKFFESTPTETDL